MSDMTDIVRQAKTQGTRAPPQATRIRASQKAGEQDRALGRASRERCVQMVP